MTKDASMVQTSLWAAEAAGAKVASQIVPLSQSQIQTYAQQLREAVTQGLERRSVLTRIFQTKLCDVPVADSLKL